jgi:hypothetical protein
MVKYRVSREPVVQPQDQSIKLIPLTLGQVATVDAAEYERVMEINWVAFWDRSTKSFYARKTNSGIFMHRFILGCDNPQIECDHINGDGLDNRKGNLREATSAQNCANRGPRKNNTSGQAGVYWHKVDEVWIATITKNGKRIGLGSFKELEKAIAARKAAEVEIHGEFAFCNRH